MSILSQAPVAFSAYTSIAGTSEQIIPVSTSGVVAGLTAGNLYLPCPDGNKLNGRRFKINVGGWLKAHGTGQTVLPCLLWQSHDTAGKLSATAPADTFTASGAGSAVTAKLSVAAVYALLAYSGITNTGATVIAGGNIGSFPTTSITGLTSANLTPPVVVDSGVDASAAQTALAAAILYYQGVTPTTSGLTDLSTGGLNGGKTYNAGNYFSVAASSLTMSDGIILDAQGNANAQFVFVAGSTIAIANGKSIQLINGAQAANVVFVVGSSFTGGTTTTINGNILAVTSVTLNGGTLNGRALANGGAVTMSAAVAVTTPSTGSSVALMAGSFCDFVIEQEFFGESNLGAIVAYVPSVVIMGNPISISGVPTPLACPNLNAKAAWNLPSGTSNGYFTPAAGMNLRCISFCVSMTNSVSDLVETLALDEFTLSME